MFLISLCNVSSWNELFQVLLWDGAICSTVVTRSLCRLFFSFDRDNFSQMRHILQQGLETVRLIGNHGMSVPMVIHLAKTFDSKVQWFFLKIVIGNISWTGCHFKHDTPGSRGKNVLDNKNIDNKVMPVIKKSLVVFSLTISSLRLECIIFVHYATFILHVLGNPYFTLFLIGLADSYIAHVCLHLLSCCAYRQRPCPSICLAFQQIWRRP